MDVEIVMYYGVAALVGMLIGGGIFFIYHMTKVGNYQTLATDILHKAELESEAMKSAVMLEVKHQELDQQRRIEKQWNAERRKIFQEEDRLKQKGEMIESRLHSMERKLSEIDKREERLKKSLKGLEVKKEELEEARQGLFDELEKVSGLTSNEARDLFMHHLEGRLVRQAANLTRKIHSEAEENAEYEAAKVISTAINRLAVSCASETTVMTIPLPNEEMKGRIIGKEGRNIRALEQATGVNIIIDDTPCAVVVSGFDPVRKEIVRSVLNELIADGRIHPTRIEELVERAHNDVDKVIKQRGEDAALRVGIIDLHPELIYRLGKLTFRYSYGQNVLDHSIETAHIIGIMAAELGLDVMLAKRIGLLHDIGKAISHEEEGSHSSLGAALAKKCGEAPEVVNGIACHHNEVVPMGVECSLCSAADALSASRPGARIEAVEEYIKRLTRLEEIAMTFSGVEKAYALQAGREVRVVVHPDMINDDEVTNIARDLAEEVEKQLKFPGKIKVTVIRERRCVEYAV
jgi:ribonucrease Y